MENQQNQGIPGWFGIKEMLKLNFQGWGSQEFSGILSPSLPTFPRKDFFLPLNLPSFNLEYEIFHQDPLSAAGISSCSLIHSWQREFLPIQEGCAASRGLQHYFIPKKIPWCFQRTNWDGNENYFASAAKKKKKFAKAALKERWLHWCDVVLVSRAGISQLLCNFWDELSRNSHFLIVEPPSPCCCHTQDALRCLGHFLMKKSDLIWWLPSFLSSIKLSPLLFPHPDFYCTP